MGIGRRVWALRQWIVQAEELDSLCAAVVDETHSQRRPLPLGHLAPRRCHLQGHRVEGVEIRVELWG